ncbi:MAG: TlpA disulfide reductase family protein [Chloroflexota bacterium]|nr:TlpA disulfide reductase family protein [Chloroflexota bacterium]
MSNLNRLLHLLAAFLSLGAAFAILLHVGLPERADYTYFRSDKDAAGAPEVGSRAPPFTLPTAYFAPRALEEARGSATIINFWATWCRPCRREMLELQTLYEHRAGKLRILAINLGESAETARRWVERLGLTYDALLDIGGGVWQRYQVRGLPTTYLLDADHHIRRVYYGPVRYEQLREALMSLDSEA